MVGQLRTSSSRKPERGEVSDFLRPGRVWPLGTFRAVATQDAVARARDGWPYFEVNVQDAGPVGETIYEIRFGDGEWMLAAEDDLVTDSFTERRRLRFPEPR